MRANVSLDEALIKSTPPTAKIGTLNFAPTQG